jgi:hypothetical protein
VATIALRSSVTTETPSAPPRRSRPSTGALTAKIAAFAAAGTVALGAGLSWQMTRGADPALGPKANVAAHPRAVRRVVETVVVRRIQAAPSAAGPAPASSTSSAAVATPPAPVTTSTS